MKTLNHTTASYLVKEDEFASLYNWSERTAVFFKTKSLKPYYFLTGMIDFMYMAAMTVVLVNCL